MSLKDYQGREVLVKVVGPTEAYGTFLKLSGPEGAIRLSAQGVRDLVAALLADPVLSMEGLKEALTKDLADPP